MPDPGPFHVYDDQRVTVLIDSASLYRMSRDLGFEVDYARLRNHFEGACRLHRAIFFAAILDTEDFNPIRKLTDYVGYNGYRVNTKVAHEHHNSEGRRVLTNVSVSVEMAVDMIDACQFSDVIVVFSTDPTLTYAIDAAQRKGVQVNLVGHNVPGEEPQTVRELRRAADHFIDIQSVMDVIMRSTNTRPIATATATLFGPKRSTPQNTVT